MVSRRPKYQQVARQEDPEDSWGKPGWGGLTADQIRALISRNKCHLAARVLYSLLVTHADSMGYIMVTLAVMSEPMGLTRSRTRNILYELRRHGYLEMVRAGVYGHPTIWRLTAIEPKAA